MGMSRNLSLKLGGATAVVFLFASMLPLWVCHSALQHSPVDFKCFSDCRQIWSPAITYAFSRGAVFLLHDDSNFVVHWNSTCSLWCDRYDIPLPNMLGSRLLTNRESLSRKTSSNLNYLALAISIWNLYNSDSLEGRCYRRVHTVDGQTFSFFMVTVTLTLDAEHVRNSRDDSSCYSKHIMAGLHNLCDLQRLLGSYHILLFPRNERWLSVCYFQAKGSCHYF